MDPPDPELDPLTLAIHQFIAFSYFQFTSHPVVYILFAVLLVQIITILLLLFDSVLRELLVDWLDESSKTQITQLIIKAIGITMLVITMLRLSVDSGDDVIIVYCCLEASLIGVLLFLLLVIKKIHLYIKEIVVLASSIWAARKQTLAYQDDRKMTADEANLIRKAISTLKTEITKLESKCNAKEKVLQSELANNRAIKDHFEGLHVEYDRLLAYNEDVRDQLREVNELLSHSKGNEDIRDQSRYIDERLSYSSGKEDDRHRSHNIDERLSYSSGKEDDRHRSHNINEKLSHYSDKKTGFFSWNLWGL